MDTKQLLKGLQALTEISEMSDYDCKLSDAEIKSGTWIELMFFKAEFAPLMTEQPLVYVSANGKMGTFKKVGKNWDWYAEKYHVKYWAYQRDIVSGLITK